jgi:hypothetical protein
MFTKSLDEQHPVVGDLLMTHPSYVASISRRILRIKEIAWSAHDQCSIYIVTTMKHDSADGVTLAIMGNARFGWHVRRESFEELAQVQSMRSQFNQHIKACTNKWRTPIFAQHYANMKESARQVELLASQVISDSIANPQKADCVIGPITHGDPCQHTWVDIGFHHSKIVCKKCNQEKT